MRIERIDRVAIAVRELEKAMTFFSSMFGIKFDEIIENDQHKYRVVYSAVGLELIEPTDISSSIDKFIRKRGEGIIFVVFKVSDIEEGKRLLQQKGLRLVGEIRRGKWQEALFHPKDSFGVQIGLCEYEAPHPTTCAALHALR